jgi:hypothetical protein
MGLETTNKMVFYSYPEWKTTTYQNWQYSISPVEREILAAREEDGENRII